jgi:predicted nucleic acid-binding protein
MKHFIDTNVLVYSTDYRDKIKQQKAEKLVQTGIKESSILISIQVLREYINVRIKRSNVVDYENIFLEAVDFTSPIMIEPKYNEKELILAAIMLKKTNSISFYDAMIVAAAQSAGCDVLYSEDMQDGQKFGKLTVVNPFK